MGLTAIGLLCDLFGFICLSLGVWLDLKRRKIEHGHTKATEYENEINNTYDNFQKKQMKLILKSMLIVNLGIKKKKALKRKRKNILI